MKWLHRALTLAPCYYGLCVNETDFRRELKRLKVPKDQWPAFVSPGANATTHFFEHPNDMDRAIVALGSTKGRSVAQVHALLVHEATHIWQEIRKSLGETEPSSEFEAYAMQNISQNLMEAWAESRKRK